MSYEAQMAELAQCAVGNHGELREVAFLSGNKDYDLVFADGTVLRPSDEAALQREYGSCAGYYPIAQQLGGTHPYSLLAFGYQGTGPGCFATFLETAGFDVTERVIVDISPPIRLRRDGSLVEDGAGDEAADDAPAADAGPAPAETAATAQDAPTPDDAAASADWYADPMTRHQYRYWDGASWTDNVSDGGQASLDPANAAPAPIAAQPAAQTGPVEFDESGRVKQVTFPVNTVWPRETSGPSTYMTRSADTLLEATEALLTVGDIPGMHYYVVETPDGNLCRDINGFYTEAPLKTRDLNLATQGAALPQVECESLTVFGDPIVNQSSVAAIRQSGQYAKFILLMECGRCGYRSPVETGGGALERQCYCCGTINTGFRGMISVVTGGGIVEI